VASKDASDVKLGERYIRIHYKNMTYVLDKDKKILFFEVLCDLFSIIEQEHLTLVTLQQNTEHNRQQLLERYVDEHMIVEHSTLDRAALLSEDHILPNHSTCFFPKPEVDFLQMHEHVLFK
jgi:hypothetical protein